MVSMTPTCQTVFKHFTIHFFFPLHSLLGRSNFSFAEQPENAEGSARVEEAEPAAGQERGGAGRERRLRAGRGSVGREMELQAGRGGLQVGRGFTGRKRGLQAEGACRQGGRLRAGRGGLRAVEGG